jgi:flagellar biosynthesis/type III secretory pathway protein FliH
MHVHDLALVPSEHLRGQTSITALGRVVLLLLARARASKNFLAELHALIPLLRAVLEGATGRDDFVSLIYYMLSVANVRAEEIVELVRERLTEPAAEDAMTAAQELIKEGRIMGWREGRAEGQALGRAEGEALGRAEGEALGRAEGEALGRVEMLAKMLRVRFGELTESQDSRLRAASIETLDAMAETVLTAQSVEEVLASR